MKIKESRLAIKQQRKSDKKKRIGTIVSIIALLLIGIAIYCIANFDHLQGRAANYVATKNLPSQRKNKQKKKDMSKLM